jgi:hypothetical protein
MRKTVPPNAMMVAKKNSNEKARHALVSASRQIS